MTIHESIQRQLDKLCSNPSCECCMGIRWEMNLVGMGATLDPKVQLHHFGPAFEGLYNSKLAN